MNFSWCKTCEEDMEVEVVDESFDHEFGVHRQYSAYCVQCGTSCSVPEPDYDDFD